MSSFNKFLLTVTAMLFPMYTQAQAPAKEMEEAKQKQDIQDAQEDATNFIRVVEEEKTARLQTSVTRYVKDGVHVDLIGAVHVADQQYFDDLNTLFEKYDVLLFELIGGERIKPGVQLEEKKHDKVEFQLLGAMQGQLMKRLDLQGQKEHIDYGAENFVHADLTIQEFVDLQKEKKESLLGFAFKNGQLAQKLLDEQKKAGKEIKQPSSFQMLKALVTGNADLLKLNLVHNLANGDEQMAAIAGDSVIIGDRNIKCLKVMNAEIEAGRKNIGIFYGAAHFPDMEDRMLKMGFKKTEQYWMTAWTIDRVKAGK